MSKSIKIRIAALPKRESYLSLEDLKKVFGGCKGNGRPCDYDRFCCSGYCQQHQTKGYGYCSSR